MSIETKRKLIKFSNYSFCITLPKEAIDEMGWKKGDTVAVVFDDTTGKITVSKTKNSNGKAKQATKAMPDDNGDMQPVPKLRW